MIRLSLVDQGTGPVLLCLHGIGSSKRSFQPQIDELSQNHRVVAWDAPGYGDSADPDGPPGLPGYAAEVATLIGGLAGRVHLLGVSWGGVIACQVALEYPDLLASLILVDASRGSGRAPAAAEAMRARADELAAQGNEAFAATRAPRLLSSDAYPALVEQVRRNMAESIRLPGYAYAAASMAETDLGPRLGEIRTPTLVLCGDRDVVSGPPESEALAAGIADAVCVSVRGAGHLSNQERPGAVNAWVASFVQIIEGLYR